MCFKVFCAGIGARYVGVDKVAVFSEQKRFIIDLLQNPIRIEIYSGIARFYLR